MCLQTYQRYICTDFRRRRWGGVEDEILRELVEKMRIGNYIPYTQSKSPPPSVHPGVLRMNIFCLCTSVTVVVIDVPFTVMLQWGEKLSGYYLLSTALVYKLVSLDRVLVQYKIL